MFAFVRRNGRWLPSAQNAHLLCADGLLEAFRSEVVLAMAVGPGLTGVLIDLGVPLPGQLWWMALWCVVASGALLLARQRIWQRQRMEQPSPCA